MMRLSKKWKDAGWRLSTDRFFLPSLLRHHQGRVQTVSQAINFHRGWIAIQRGFLNEIIETTDHPTMVEALKYMEKADDRTFNKAMENLDTHKREWTKDE